MRRRRFPSLADVAAAAGVSKMTVSRALRRPEEVSAAVRERVLRVTKDLGYTPLYDQRPSSQPQALGLISAFVHSVFMAEFLGGAIAAARESGFETLVYSAINTVEVHRGTSELLARTVQGVMAVLPLRREHLDAIGAAGLPVVAFECDNAEGYRFRCDNHAGARAAVRHLVDLGHRRIAHVSGPEGRVCTEERRKGWEDVLREAGIPADPLLLDGCLFGEASGRLAAQRLLSLPNRPTAIFAANDQAAIGVLRAAEEAGLRVPEDLSVVGFDDLPFAARTRPPLTTVQQPLQQMGRAAVKTLLTVLAGIEPVFPEATFPTQLIVRESTAPPATRRARRRPGAPARAAEDRGPSRRATRRS